MYNIEYISYIGTDNPTNTHPHYQTIFNHLPLNFTVSSNPQDIDNKIPNILSRDFSDVPEPQFWINFINKCLDNQYTQEQINDFISKIHPGTFKCPKTTIGFAPTLRYIGPYNSFVWMEEWNHLFCYYLNCHTKDIDFNEPYFGIMTNYMSMDNFKGIITHMKDSIKNFNVITKNKIPNKFFYCPLAMEEATHLISYKKLNKSLNILMTNSYGAGVTNFHLRGGYESIHAVQSLINMGYPIKLTVCGPVPANITSIRNENIHFLPGFIEPNEFKNILSNTDVFLIPSMRVHTISTVQSMCYGIVPIVSDGWGFDEYVSHQQDGLIASGAYGFTTWRDENGVFRENYEDGWRQNFENLSNSIIEQIKYLFDNPNKLEEMSKNAKERAISSYNIATRNKILEEILLTSL